MFVERGYLATTMADLADAAGVSVQTLYLALGSKVEILGAVLDQAVAGDDEPVPLLEREWVRDLERAPSGASAVELLAREGARVVARAAPVYRQIQEAAADVEVAELLARARAQRHETMQALASILARKKGFTCRLHPARQADVLYALISEESYRLLCGDRGWRHTEWERWTADALKQSFYPA